MLRSMLQQKREERVRPGLDDKVLADWNGLMIAALANAGAMLGESDWIALGARAFDFIAERHDPRRPARPFLARGQIALSRVSLPTMPP